MSEGSSPRLPLSEKTDSARNSQNLTIRVVPYSPPRPSDRDGEVEGEDDGNGNDDLRLPSLSPSPLESRSRSRNTWGLEAGDDSNIGDISSISDTGNITISSNIEYHDYSDFSFGLDDSLLAQSNVVVVGQEDSRLRTRYDDSLSSGSSAKASSHQGSNRSTETRTRIVEAHSPLSPSSPSVAVYAAAPTTALSSASSLALSLARRRDEGVSGLSGSTPTSHHNSQQSESTSPVIIGPAGVSTTTSPHIHNTSSVNPPSSVPSSASHLPYQPFSSLSVSASTSPTPTPTQLHPPRSPLFDQEGTGSGTNSGPTSPLLRPLSRRRHVVAINSSTKTFTLVPHAERAERRRSSHNSQLSSASAVANTTASSFSHSGGVNEFGALRANPVGSPPVSSTFSTLSTISTATASIDRPSSDVFSDDRPSSALTTIPDTDDTTASPGGSPKTPVQIHHHHYHRESFFQEPEQHQLEDEAAAAIIADPNTSNTSSSTPTAIVAHTRTPPSAQSVQSVQSVQSGPSQASASPWNYRLVGGLRKVPKTPDLKRKGKGKQIVRLEDEQDDDILEDSTTSTTSVSLPPLPPLKDLEALPTLPTLPKDDPKTPTFSGNTAETHVAAAALPQYHQHNSQYHSHRPNLAAKASFHSASTISERTNYKVYGESSPVLPDEDSLLDLPPSSSHSQNYVLLGHSSSPAPSLSSEPPVAPSSDLDSNENYVLHRHPSSSASNLTDNKSIHPTTSTDSLIVAQRSSSYRRGPRNKYSQESLIIPPLQVRKKKSFDKIGYYRQRSRESLRSTPSLKSISTVATHEAARAFFAAPTIIDLQGSAAAAGLVKSKSTKKPPKAILTGPSGGSHKASQSPRSPKKVRMESHAHVWSSQLSTVMSESEGGSEGGPGSRSPSAFSGGRSGSGRRSSGFSFFGGASTRSRRMGSISSSIAAEEQQQPSSSSGHTKSHSRSDSSGQKSQKSPHSRSDSLDRPQAAHTRPSQPSRTVRDQDEHGDGLADLHELHHRPSRNGLYALFRSNSSDRNLHSSSSSRNGSFTASSLPAWARFYYTNEGENQLLSAPSISSPSESGSRPGSGWGRSGSPSSEHLPQLPVSMYSSRKRTNEGYMPAIAGPSSRSRSHQQVPSETGSMGVAGGAPPMTPYGQQLRRKPSSIWSPHLRFDRYASRYSVWDPPSVQWSAESGPLGKRNLQVILFVVGFICPFTWMVAAFLPLPPDPKVLLRQEMAERGGSSSTLDYPAEVEQTRNGAAAETRFQSARWWRTLNRFMAVFGLLVLAAVITLVVIGVCQRWGR